MVFCVTGIPTWRIGGVNAVFTMDVNEPEADFSEWKLAVGIGFTFELNDPRLLVSGLEERYSIYGRVDEVGESLDS